MTTIGSDPVQLNWNVTRGDTSILRIDFFEDDETTRIDNTTWDAISTAYNPKTKETYDLDVTSGTGFIEVIANSDTTIDWASGFGSVIGMLYFDVQITISDTVWTPVSGTITVLGNVSGVL